VVHRGNSKMTNSTQHIDLALLDAATRQIERDVWTMIARLDRANRTLDAIFAERDRLRARRAPR